MFFTTLYAQSLSDLIFKYFLPFCALCFHITSGVFCSTKILNFDEVQFTHFFPLVAYDFGVITKKQLPNPRDQRYTHIFSKIHTILVFTFRFLIHFELVFVQSECEREVTQSCPTLCEPWSVAYQAPPPMGFSRQEYWSGLLFPSPGDLPYPGTEPRSPAL